MAEEEPDDIPEIDTAPIQSGDVTDPGSTVEIQTGLEWRNKHAGDDDD